MGGERDVCVYVNVRYACVRRQDKVRTAGQGRAGQGGECVAQGAVWDAGRGPHETGAARGCAL